MRTESLVVRLTRRLFCLAWLIALPAAAQFTLPMAEQLSLNPTVATASGTISVSGSRLADGDYLVELVQDARTRHTLTAISAGSGEFQRTIKLPAIPTGSYPVELLVGGRLVDSVTLRIVSPLAVSATNLSPRAGSKLGFTVSGLTAGTLTMIYAGKPAFGPVQVSAGSYSGTMLLPTDRPATLPATVALGANNATGKLVPRVGSRNLSVQAANTNPFLRITSAATSDSSPSPRERFTVSGSLAANEAEIGEAQVHHYWVAGDGSVMPMGAPSGLVQADGSFTYSLTTPQIGTGSAGHAQGDGHVMSVTQWRDEHGVLQSESSRGPDLTAGIDTDAAIDISFTLTGNDGQRIEGARIVMTEGDPDELYPPNSNSGGVFLNGANAPQFEYSQFQNNPLYVAGSCPPSESLQYTDDLGQAEFEFGLDIPGGNTGLINGITPQVTILPSEDCFSPSINDHVCFSNDPAGIRLKLSVLALHTGYGFAEETVVNGIPTLKENLIEVYARVDRYIGSIQTEICYPGQSPYAPGGSTCDQRDFSRSANISLILPKAPTPSLILGVPYLPAAGTEQAIDIEQAQWGEVARYAPIADVGAFEGEASFNPETPPTRSVTVQHLRGAGPAMATGFPKLVIPLRNGEVEILTMTSSAEASCDVPVGAVTYSVTLPANVSEGLRFPRKAFGNRDSVRLSIVGKDTDGRTGLTQAELRFVAPGADATTLVGRPGLIVDTRKPHARKLTRAPADTSAHTHSDSPPAEYNVGAKDNRAELHEDYQFCLPAGSNCGAFNSLDSSHEQFSRPGDSPPAGGTATGSDQILEGSDTWEVLFDKTIPLFRWYWGVPELLSAEVFADLKLKAEYLFQAVFDPESPGSSFVKTGGRMGVGIFIGVDIDVLFGILVDAGAGISGFLTGEVVAEGGATRTPCVRESLSFRMDFSGWLEIGCPIPNPFDPTCYIPDIEETYNILNEQILGGAQCVPVNKQSGRFSTVLAKLDAVLQAPTGLIGTPGPGPIRPVAIDPVDAEQRRALHRHSAIAADSAGNRMTLYVSQLGHLVAVEQPTEGGRNFHTLSEDSFGVRDIAVSYFSADRAVAVWSQSDITDVDQPVTDLASRQHLQTAIWNGSAWSSPTALTSPGFGDGGTRMARCVPRPTSLRGDCSSRKVSVVYQRNTQRTMKGHKHVYIRHFNGSSWSGEERVDSSGDYNLTPTVAYQNAQPVVAWVRYDSGTVAGTPDDPALPALSKVDNRRLAMRTMDGSGVEEVLNGLPTRVAQPSLAAIDGSTLALAYTRAAASDAFVGLRQGLHLASLNCATRPCRNVTRTVRDERGRQIFGERPTVLVRPNGNVSIGFRALSLGAVPGAEFPESNLFANDPPGLLAGVGAVLDLRTNLVTGRAALVDLGSHLGVGSAPAFALDAVSNEVLGTQALVDIDLGDVFTKARDGKTPLSHAKVETLEEGLMQSVVDDVPDLAIAAVEANADRLIAGTDIPVTVRIANRGSDWTPDADRVATLRLYWDTPETRSTLLAQVPLVDLAAGSSVNHVVQARVPAAFGNDERQSVRAEILVESPEGELNGSNNVGSVALGGMPIPQDLHSLSLPGERFVNVQWTPMTDDRIAGYRIHVELDDGNTVPIGSSFNPGYTDLSARFGQTRRYRVSTYSARGIESELSEAVSASPALKAVVQSGPSGDHVFGNGFENTTAR